MTSFTSYLYSTINSSVESILSAAYLASSCSEHTTLLGRAKHSRFSIWSAYIYCQRRHRSYVGLYFLNTFSLHRKHNLYRYQGRLQNLSLYLTGPRGATARRVGDFFPSSLIFCHQAYWNTSVPYFVYLLHKFNTIWFLWCSRCEYSPKHEKNELLEADHRSSLLVLLAVRPSLC